MGVDEKYCDECKHRSMDRPTVYCYQKRRADGSSCSNFLPLFDMQHNTVIVNALLKKGIVKLGKISWRSYVPVNSKLLDVGLEI